jgi:hypothetical protein
MLVGKLKTIIYMYEFRLPRLVQNGVSLGWICFLHCEY